MNEEDGEGAVFHPWAVSGDRKDRDGVLEERQPSLPRKLPVEWRDDKPLPDGLQGKAVPELGVTVLPPGRQHHSCESMAMGSCWT